MGANRCSACRNVSVCIEYEKDGRKIVTDHTVRKVVLCPPGDPKDTAGNKRVYEAVLCRPCIALLKETGYREAMILDDGTVVKFPVDKELTSTDDYY